MGDGIVGDDDIPRMAFKNDARCRKEVEVDLPPDYLGVEAGVIQIAATYLI